MSKLHTDTPAVVPPRKRLMPVDALARRATPVVNSNFVVVQLAIAGSATNLLAAVNTAVVAVGTAISHTYPTASPTGLLITAAAANPVTIMTNNVGGTEAAGINIPTGESLYLPILGPAAAVLCYIAASVVSVAVFYEEG